MVLGNFISFKFTLVIERQLPTYSLETMNSTKVLEWLAKITVYAILVILFFYFYLIDLMCDYVKGRTTITSRTESVEFLEPPTFTICLDPPLKSTVATSYNFSNDDDLFLKDFPDTDFRERFSKVTYILNQDYELEIAIRWPDPKWFKVSKGIVEVDQFRFEVNEVITWGQGMCLNIQPKFIMNEAPLNIVLRLKPNSGLEEMDEINRIEMFLTSNDTWENLIMQVWPQFKPTMLGLSLNTIHTFTANPTEHIFSDHDDQSFEDCWIKNTKNFDCLSKCQIVSLSDKLPFCTTFEEVQCIINEIIKGNVWTICNFNPRALTFEGTLSKITKHQKDNWTDFDIYLHSMKKEIKEEVDVITLPELIGSVGGSLGMFFGFSISALVLFYLEKWITLRNK